MNASDIIKAKQSRTLYQAYYRPTIFSSLINSTINYCPVSTVSTVSGFESSLTSCITMNYLYRCTPPVISYELANSINNGKYECGFPYCSTISIWNTGQTFITGNCACKESFLTWKNTNQTTIISYNSTSISSFSDPTSTVITTGPGPIICPLVSFYQGTNFDNSCSNCNTTVYGENGCCVCTAGQ
jgi:hypothetical protein